MNYTTLTFVIIAILLLDFLVEHTLSFLNAKYAKTELPEELSDVYDKNEYARQQMYLRANKQFAHVSGAFSFL
ncbi:MAG: M48 family peptidase, partial [Paludibacteraceae bacterium]|nr:M48 family peptidase [Paludibacteraceae bacterium]